MMMNRVDTYLNRIEDHLKAAKTLDSALIFNGIPDYNFSGALVNYNLKRYESAYKHLLKYAVSGKPLSSLINNHSDSSGYKFRQNDLDFMLKKYPKLQHQYAAIQQKTLLSINLTLNNELIKLFEKDQAIRKASSMLSDRLDSVCRKNAEAFIGQEIENVDSAVFANFKQLIGQYGLPTKSKVTFDAFSAFYFILMHGYTNSYSYSFCDSILKIAKHKFNQEPFLTPQEYALIIDRYYIDMKNINFYCEYNDTELPIFEPQKLNERRREIYLPEIELPK